MSTNPSKRKREVSPASPASVKNEDLGELCLAGESPPPPSQPCGTVKMSASQKDVIVIDNDEPSPPGSDPTTSTAPAPCPEAETLIGLDQCFKGQHLWLVNTLLAQPVATHDTICHLSDVPSDAKWNGKNTLVNSLGRAIVIVAFGSLSSVNLVIARGKATTLSVSIDLLREKDVESLRRVYEVAQVPNSHDTGKLDAYRISYDPRSRIMNVFDLTEQMPANPKAKPECIGVNALIGGDVMRMDMRCVRVRQPDGVMAVQFKMKAAHLLVAVPRAVDLLN
ncbi:hypothetical protein GSI_12389 [Ganoderma sinense ZZ0214-1]|uniref:Uncharacterized protein n=1 Tax=Ganoderma sinense ZZ0214-1 TaxID=1077348 RepID=A0A2G8RVK9_9APHY|nr:hypothetical protein GSI_12389 [Ganoderma sinense ZZ0214-1]